MSRAGVWIFRDILGLPHAPRVKPERRSGRWRLLGWVLALVPWLVLAVLWWPAVQG